MWYHGVQRKGFIICGAHISTDVRPLVVRPLVVRPLVVRPLVWLRTPSLSSWFISGKPELRKTTIFSLVNITIPDLFFPSISIFAEISSISVSIDCLPAHCFSQECFNNCFYKESLVWVSLNRFVAVVFPVSVPVKAHFITSRCLAFAPGWAVQISSDGVIHWGRKPRPKKIPGPKIDPKKSHAQFPCLENFQKALNVITRK